MSDEASRTTDDVKPPRTRRRVDVNVQVVSYNTRGYRAKHTTIPKARRIKDRSFRAHPRLVVVPCVQLLYEAAPFLPSPSPDLFASARRSARLRFASFLRTRKHNRHVFSSPSKSRNTSSAFRQLLQNRLGSAPRPVASNGGTVFARAAEDDGRRSRSARPRPRRAQLHPPRDPRRRRERTQKSSRRSPVGLE